MLKSHKKITNNNNIEIEKLCECRPICRNRRRTWKGRLLKTSAELLSEKELAAAPLVDYSVVSSKPSYSCPTGGSLAPVNSRKTSVVKVCKASVAESVATPCMEYTELAKRLGAWTSVRGECAFCSCHACCLCSGHDYALADEGAERRRGAMRDFDLRVRSDCRLMRIMYDGI